jgi:hypothetical protein
VASLHSSITSFGTLLARDRCPNGGYLLLLHQGGTVRSAAPTLVAIPACLYDHVHRFCLFVQDRCSLHPGALLSLSRASLVRIPRFDSISLPRLRSRQRPADLPRRRLTTLRRLSSRQIAEVGVEPTIDHHPLEMAALPVCVLGCKLRERESNPRRTAYETVLEPLQSTPQYSRQDSNLRSSPCEGDAVAAGLRE